MSCHNITVNILITFSSTNLQLLIGILQMMMHLLCEGAHLLKLTKQCFRLGSLNPTLD